MRFTRKGRAIELPLSMTERAPHEPQSAPLFPDGEYEVDNVLGSGGMAVVYRARDLRHPRKVAIKVLRSDVAQVVGVERFLREIAVTSAFTHPHILPLLDSGETKDANGRSAPYYVMPLIEGDSLADRIDKENRLSLQDSIRLATEILEALRYAH
jgi:serine/threonine protein kinase